MGKQSKSRKPEIFGKGKVTPVQIAFIVDRYLSDNDYTQTRSTFRFEASDLISKSPVQEAPKSLLSLGAMLDEYICLKEQKLIMAQEKCHLEQEKFRVQALLQGMQGVMNAYNAGGAAPLLPHMVPPSGAKTAGTVTQAQIGLSAGSPAGYSECNTPVVMSRTSSLSTPGTDQTQLKRKNGSKDASDRLAISKRYCRQSNTNLLPVKDTNILLQKNMEANSHQCSQTLTTTESSFHVPGNVPVQGSSVAKCLFKKPSTSPQNSSSGPKTPPQATSSQTDKLVSAHELASTALSEGVNHQPITSTNYTVISSETISVSPSKQLPYYSIERSHCISISSPVKANLKGLTKRECVKGRLDFDSSDIEKNWDKPLHSEISPSKSDEKDDIFDFDLPHFDTLGDFSLSEMLVDFDFDGNGIDHSSQPNMNASEDVFSGPPQKSGNGNTSGSQEIFSENDMHIPGPDSVTSVMSITKRIKILSPAKNKSIS